MFGERGCGKRHVRVLVSRGRWKWLREIRMDESNVLSQPVRG